MGGVWEFTSSGYSIGSGPFKYRPITGDADTGSSLLLLPRSIVTAYYKEVNGAEYDSDVAGYTFPCSAAIPDFTFGVGSARITIPARYLIYAQVTDTICYGGIQRRIPTDTNSFGIVALKAAFVVFDGASNRLGWANKILN